MPLIPGTRLGPYEITAQIGVGGMGEVYGATKSCCTRWLDRDVAIKVLPASLAGDPERIARFQREAKTLAALNHPNIAAIYGLEEADQTKARCRWIGANRRSVSGRIGPQETRGSRVSLFWKLRLSSSA